MPRQFLSLQSLRGIAVLLVVVLHIYAFEAKAGVGPSFLPHFSLFGSSGVDLFFVISGFVMVFTTVNVRRSLGSFLRFLYKRVTRIYPLYWLITAVLLLGYFVFPHYIQREGLSDISFVKAVLLLPQVELPYLIVGWTLIHELYFYAVFSLFILFPRQCLVHLLLAWLFLIIFLNQQSASETSPTLLLISNPLTLEFILGCFAGLLVVDNQRRFAKMTTALGVFLLVGGWLYYHHFVHSELLGWTRALLLGVPYSMIVYGATAWEARGSLRNSSLLVTLGDASYSIYLLHFLVISVVSKLWVHLFPAFPHSSLDNLAFIITCLLLSCLSGLLSFRYIEQPLIAVSRFRSKQKLN